MLRSAHAQSESSCTIVEQLFAELLFWEGRELTQAKRWAEACPKFEASQRYDPGPGTQLELAFCDEHFHKLATAWNRFRDYINSAKKEDYPEFLVIAQREAAELEPKLATLTIFATANPPAGFVVTRDGTKVNPEELGAARYVDAGTYQITASAPGFEPFARTITVVDGQAETLAIPLLTAKPVPAVVTRSSKPVPQHHVKPPEPTAPPSRTRTYVAIGAGAAGVAAVGIGLAFGAKANSTYKEARKPSCSADLACSNPADYREAMNKVHDARSSATISTALVIAGGAAIAAGAVVFLTAPRSPERATVHVLPVVHDHGAGLAITRGF